MKKFKVAVVGATGLVGENMVRVLEEKNFPVSELVPLASEASQGKSVIFYGKPVPVRVLDKNSFAGVDFALFSAGASVSQEYAPVASDAGAIVIDNTSAFRMDPEILLIVPEVNGHLLKTVKGGCIIANPNCSTIQLVCVLKPIHDAVHIKRVVVSTYQSVSGAGKEAMEELEIQTQEPRHQPRVFPHPIAFNCIPHIDIFEENGYTKEEMKLVRETKKIMGDDSIAVTCTAVRVPVKISHSESVNIQTEKNISAEEVRKILSHTPNIIVVDDPKNKKYPLARNAAGKNEVFVGRIRRDISIENGIDLWVVADNLRKGAATNAVQIAEILAA